MPLRWSCESVLATYYITIWWKKVLFLKDTKDTLSFIKELLEKGSFKPVIDRIYPLEKIADAFTYIGSGQKIGNVSITMDYQDDKTNY